MATINTSTKNTLPTPGTSTFSNDLRTFLAEEDAERFQDIFNAFVVQNGLHGTGASLTGDPGDTIAYPDGFYVNETGTITYPDDTANIWVVIHKDKVTDPGGDWQRVSGTHYLYDPVASSQPTPPSGSIILMRVVTSGGSITTVGDLRNTDAFTTTEGKIKISSDDTTANYVDGKLLAGSGITFTVGSGGGDETLTIASDGKAQISAGDTTANYLDNKITGGDGITTTKINSLGDESLDIDIDLATNPGLEFSSNALRVKTAIDGGIQRTAEGTEVDINGTSELTSGLDTPDDEMLIYDTSASGLKKIKMSLLMPTGTTVPYVGTTAPVAWVLAQGGTIGNASSGGTARANADTEELFKLIWNSMANGQAAVSSGRGASAQADFDADKTITLPDLRGNVPVGKDSGTFSTLGDTGGAETHTLTVDEMPAHTHTQTLSDEADGSGNTGEKRTFTGNASGAQHATGSTGGGSAHNNLQPWISLNYIIKL